MKKIIRLVLLLCSVIFLSGCSKEDIKDMILDALPEPEEIDWLTPDKYTDDEEEEDDEKEEASPTKAPAKKATSTPKPTKKPTSTPTPTKKAAATPTPTRKPRATATPTPVATPTPADSTFYQTLYVAKRVEEISEELDLNGKSEIEIVKAVHDYLVLNTAYDSASVDEDYDRENNWISHTAYGALYYQTAVCDGYSNAFKAFMDYHEIDCILVEGEGNGTPHAWNQVRIDNEWYELDVTWDDPLLDGEDRPGNVSYNYFLITSEQMAEDHVTESANAHICTSTKYEAYAYMDYYFEDMDEVDALVYNQISEPFIQLAFETGTQDDKEVLYYVLDLLEWDTLNYYSSTSGDLTILKVINPGAN